MVFKAEVNTVIPRMKDMMCSGNGERLGVVRTQGIWEKHKTKKERRVTI